MKILHITDIHFKIFVFDWIASHQNQYDAICITGDFLDESCDTTVNDQVNYISDWLSRIITPIFVCSGNHDLFDESFDWMSIFPKSDGTITEINGIKIGCAPEDCEDFLKYRSCNILLHHYPPFGSKTARDQNNNDYGSIFLKNNLSFLSCNYILCGHTHRPNSRLAYSKKYNKIISNAGGNHKLDAIKYYEVII